MIRVLRAASLRGVGNMAAAPAALTNKDLKALARPEFANAPELYYPTGALQRLGFHRAKCACGAHYWRVSEKQQTCGDSKCVGRYEFIGRGCGLGEKGHKLTYSQAWETFRDNLTTARIPCKAISRYPVVARWRSDVDYVAAGIYCFQPYCVTGELAPPANPLICPQFCVRFNDLDNIGLTGRHYSGFVMLGIQAFNYPGKHVFFKDECVEFNLRWLVDGLQIPKDRITLIEDVWAGGGNLGPCVEYFVDGLEVGNMVFMQYKTRPDGRREELPVKVVDVGVGLERIPWLVNGSATSYEDVFSESLHWLKSVLGVTINSSIWQQFGPLSCRLNIDETEDIEATWRQIAALVGKPVEEVKAAISPARDLYIVLDHTRTALIAIEDGSLPSNVGGGGNVRNVLRRVFALLHKRGWWDSLGISGLLTLFEKHRIDLSALYGPFKPHKSFQGIIESEYQRWLHTDAEQSQKLQKLIRKRKGSLGIEDWVVAVTSWGVPADVVANAAKQEVPGNLYYTIAERQEKLVKQVERSEYNTEHLPETVSLYYTDQNQAKFTATVIEVLQNAKTTARDIVVLNQSAFYPTSGGQLHDTGSLHLSGKSYKVIDVQKVGPTVLHFLSEPVPAEVGKGAEAVGEVEMGRRKQLQSHHTATHLLFAASRRVLGPHVWQNGAKKTVEGAHLDITHHQSLSHADELSIENEANRLISRSIPITKSYIDKAQAEQEYGFTLYQGGVVPGNNLRVVDIQGVDTEACCGTHCDNTAEVGRVRVVRTSRISDGIVRLSFVAGEKALEQLNAEDHVLNTLMETWNVPLTDVIPTAERFFSGYKRLETRTQKQEIRLLELTMRSVLTEKPPKYYILTDQENPTLYFSQLPAYADRLQSAGKSVIFIGSKFVFGLLSDAKDCEFSSFGQYLAGKDKKPVGIRKKEQKRGKSTPGACEFVATAETVDLEGLKRDLRRQGFEEF